MSDFTIHHDPAITLIQRRFEALRDMMDIPTPKFEKNHKSEVYKAILKTLIVSDKGLVEAAIGLVGMSTLVYPMLHLSHDTNEMGTWHRDGAEKTCRVFWIPLSFYKYPALSFVPYSSGFLSPILAQLAKVINLDWLEDTCGPMHEEYFSWPARMMHKGNLNTSDDMAAALVIFTDPAASHCITGTFIETTPAMVKSCMKTIYSALWFGEKGNVADVDKRLLNELPDPFRSRFMAQFKLRTGFEL